MVLLNDEDISLRVAQAAMRHVLNVGFAKQDVRFLVSVLLRGLFIVSITSCAAFCNILSGWLKLGAHP